MANINGIITQVTSHGVLRNNRFRIYSDGLPSTVTKDGGVTDPQSPFGTLYVQSTTTPDHTISTVNIPYRGRQLPFVGDRSFANWSFTVIDDSKHNFRTVFEEWINSMQDEETLVR